MNYEAFYFMRGTRPAVINTLKVLEKPGVCELTSFLMWSSYSGFNNTQSSMAWDQSYRQCATFVDAGAGTNSGGQLSNQYHLDVDANQNLRSRYERRRSWTPNFGDSFLSKGRLASQS